MMTTSVNALNRSYQKSHEWLQELTEFGFRSEGEAYSALRSVLHALRDRLSIHEAAHLASQLPLMLRGTFYEGWHPAQPLRDRHAEAFFDCVECELGRGSELDPIQAVEAVFAFLATKLSVGEAEDIAGVLPRHLRSLWPELPHERRRGASMERWPERENGGRRRYARQEAQPPYERWGKYGDYFGGPSRGDY